jgi:hypothetical protein
MMKRVFLIFLIVSSYLFASSETTAILNEIKQLREDTNKRFEQIDRRFEQIDQHFGQVNRQFEAVDQRLAFLQNLLLAIVAIVIATPLIARKLDERDSVKLEKIEKVLVVLRELAQDNPKVDKSMKIAGLS